MTELVQEVKAGRRRWAMLWFFYCVLLALGTWKVVWLVLAIVCSIMIFVNSVILIKLESSEETT